MYKYIYELVRNKKIVLSAEAAMELADEAMDDVPEEVEGEVTKIQTIDILAQVMNKFDTYMNDTELNFNFFINNNIFQIFSHSKLYISKLQKSF